MEKEYSFFRPHPDPFVQILLNTELVPETMIPILSNPIVTTNPKIQALITILLADIGIKPFEEANKFAESVYMLPCHVDLQLMFLAAWYGNMIALSSFPLDQMNAISAAMNGLISEDTLPEIKATVKCVQAINYSDRWDFSSMLKLTDQMLDNIPRQSYYYKKYAIFSAIAFCEHGMGTHVQHFINNVKPSEYDERGLIIAKFINGVLTGELTETSALIEKISALSDNKFYKVFSRAIEMSCTLIAMMSKFNGQYIYSPTISKLADYKSSWARSTQALLERKPEEALHWARLSADEITSRSGSPLDFVIHTLVRAELATGNGAGAKRLLLHLAANGTETYLSDFYFARAEKLLGNYDLAAAHFAKLHNSIDKYQAHKRFDFEVALSCELAPSDLVKIASNAIKVSQEDLEIPSTEKSGTKGLNTIISINSTMQNIKDSIIKFADLSFPVLITGETGTGKELVARALHDISKRQQKRFIAVNCSSISDALIESEFFGHEPGAFTGAQSAYKGIFREAGEGTVFLDEIADISPQLQVSLLRILETGEIRPVGSSANHIVKCRIIVATNKPLEPLVEQNKFRQDLLYRLQRFEVQLPSLKERPEDIEELVRYFFNSERRPAEKVTLSLELMEDFKKYSWPGNVRELRNIIQRMRVLSSDKLNYDLSDLHRCGYSLQTKSNKPLSNSRFEDNKPQVATNQSSNITKLHLSNTHSETFIDSQSFFSDANNTFRRKRKLRELFDKQGELKVSEAASFLGVTPNTVCRYMAELCQEGVIEKISPNASPKSRYYVKKKS